MKDPPGCTQSCNYQVFWDLKGNDITFTVYMEIDPSIPAAKQVVLVGFSQTKSTTGMECLYGYFDDKNKPVVRDGHYDASQSAVVPDVKNNVEKFDLKKNNTHWRMLVTRAMVTGDQSDLHFTKADKDKVYVVVPAR